MPKWLNLIALAIFSGMLGYAVQAGASPLICLSGVAIAIAAVAMDVQ